MRNWKQYNERLVQRGEIILDAVDIKSKQVVSMEATDEKSRDGKRLKALVKKVLCDGGYDSHENFNFPAREGIEAGIKVRGGSNPQCCGERREVGYGQR